MIWAASQASPIRRIQVDGDLDLFEYFPPYPNAGYASGGYMSDCTVSGTITSGSQQQYLARNNAMGGWKTGVWNMVFVGNQNAPASHCGNADPQNPPYTTVDSTPIIVEKPYIVQSGAGYSIMVPRVEQNKVGPTPGYNNADEVPFDKVYVASETDSAATINAKLAEGLHLVFQPGQYKLDDTIMVNNANTVVLGVGLATLISTTGKPVIQVANVDGVKISGLLLQAGPQDTEALLKWGEKGYAGSAAAPGAMHDVFARVGGPDHDEVKTDVMVQINSGNVIIDDTWLWRADHSVDGLVANSKNPVKSGLQVNGDNVTGYGLAAEHTLGNLLEWNGENGRTYFYQSEYPYDVDQSYADGGFASYRVGDEVKTHEAWGVGVYSYFRDHTVDQPEGIKAPETPGVKFHNSLSVFLNGMGDIKHVIDDQGDEVQMGDQVHYVCEWTGGSSKKAEELIQ